MYVPLKRSSGVAVLPLIALLVVTITPLAYAPLAGASLAHGCNCAGSMRAGVAVGFKARYPAMFDEFRRRCKADPPQLHGPYYQWTRKVDGKTVTRWLSPDQLARYQPWFRTARRLRELITELEALSLRIAERAEGWDPQPPPTGHQPRPNDRGLILDAFVPSCAMPSPS